MRTETGRKLASSSAVHIRMCSDWMRWLVSIGICTSDRTSTFRAGERRITQRQSRVKRERIRAVDEQGAGRLNTLEVALYQAEN